MSAPKLLGGVSLSAATAANVFDAVTAAKTFNVRFVNRNTSTATVKLGLSTTSATFANASYLEYNQEVPANGTLELTGIACNTEYLVAESDIASVTCVAYGIEV